jgi:hypothetical protein
MEPGEPRLQRMWHLFCKRSLLIYRNPMQHYKLDFCTVKGENGFLELSKVYKGSYL